MGKKKNYSNDMQGSALKAWHKCFPCANATSLKIINNAFARGGHNNGCRKSRVS